MMYTIAYISRAADHMEVGQIKELLEYAGGWNSSNNLKGLLLYNEGNFFQVIEGEKETVVDLYDKIKEDSRHDNLVELFSEPTRDPVFEDYSSRFNLITNEYDLITLKEYLKRRKITFQKPGLVNQIETFLGAEWSS